MSIHKTVITVTVLSQGPLSKLVPQRDEYGYNWLAQVAEEISDGDSIGDWVIQSSSIVPPEKVVEELEAIGNDGDFFECDDCHRQDGTHDPEVEH